MSTRQVRADAVTVGMRIQHDGRTEEVTKAYRYSNYGYRIETTSGFWECGPARLFAEVLTAPTSRCSECLREIEEGKRDPELEPAESGYEECGLCGEPACESHGRNYDSNMYAGWFHESCVNSPSQDRGRY